MDDRELLKQLRKKYGTGSDAEREADTDQEKLAVLRKRYGTGLDGTGWGKMPSVTKPKTTVSNPLRRNDRMVALDDGNIGDVASIGKKSPAVTPAGNRYYSKPELYQDAEWMRADIMDTEGAFLDAQRRAESVGSALERAAAALAANPQNQWFAYEYGKKLDEYKTVYGQYRTVADKYGTQAKDFNSYLEDQGDRYDAWRSTVRSEEDVQAEIDSIDKRLDELKSIESKFLQLENYVGPGEDYSVSFGGFSSLEDVQAEIRRLTGEDRRLLSEEKDWAKYFRYSDMMSSEDFDRYASEGKAVRDNITPETASRPLSAWESLTYQMMLDRGDEEGAREYLDNIANHVDNWHGKYMTPDEIKISDYLLAKEGAAAAKEYQDYLENSLNARYGADIGKDVRGIDSGILRALATGGYGLVAGADQFVGGVKQFFSNEELPTSPLQYGSQYIQNDLAGNKLGGLLYGAATTIGNMAPSILVSAVTGGIGGAAAGTAAKIAGAASMGVSASGNAYGQKLAEGYSEEQARTYSVLVGASEAALQYLMGGIGALGGVTDDILLAKVAAIDNALARVALTGAIKVGGEVIEEEMQAFLEPLFASVVFNEEYDVPTVEELVETAIVTAISTGVLEGGNILSAGKSSPATDASKTGDAPQPVDVPVAQEAPLSLLERAAQEMAQNGSISNNTAERIMADPTAMEQLGVDTNGMTKRQTRNAVKDAVAGQNPTQEAASAVENVAAPVQQTAHQRASESETALRIRQGERASAALGENGARAFKAAYDETTAATLSAEDAYSGFARVYNAALKGETVESDLPAHMKLAAETAAQNDALRAEQAAYFGEKSGVVRDDNFKKAHLSSRTVRTLDAVAKVAGVQVRVVDRIIDTDGAEINARYRNGVIEVSSKSANPVRVAFSHEIVHRIRETAPAAYESLSRFVQTHINSGVMQGIIETYGGKTMYNTSDASAINEEIVADAVGLMLGDSKVMERFVKDDRNAAEKLRDVIRDLVNAVKRALNGQNVKLNETQVAAFSELLSDIEGFESVLTDALNAIPQNEQKNTTREGGEWKNSKSTDAAQADVTAEYHKAVDNILQGKDKRVRAVLLGYTPEIYRKLGMPSLPFVISSGHIYSIAKTEAEAKADGRPTGKTHYHGLGETAVKKLLDAAQEPVAIISAKDVSPNATPLRSTHSVVAIIDVGSSDKSLLIPVELTAERTVDGQRMDVNVLSSAYKRDVSGLLTEAVAQENAGDVGVYYVKKEATGLIGAGVQFPIRLQDAMASDGIVHRFSEKVNMNILEQTQSQQFKRWFGDWQNNPKQASKIVNVDGTPKVMYHGSPAQFTVFDKKKAKSSGHYGRGFYFSDSDAHAGTYGNTYSVYLNIRNPLQDGKTTVSRDQVRRFLKAVAENEDYSIENYGTYDIDAVLGNIMGKENSDDAFKVIQDISLTAVGDMVEAAELFNRVNGTKFDGIVVPTETVAFYPEQVKSASDNIGTFDGGNPDIRYSRQFTPEAERALRESVGDAQLAGMMNQGRKDAKKLREANERTAKVREQRDQKIRELKAQQKERMAKRREQLTAKEYREKIERHVKDLSQKLLKPTDKRHIPEDLRKAVASLLDAINLESSYTLDPDTIHEVIRKDGKSGGITGKHLKDGSGLPTQRTKAALELKAAYQKVINDEASDMVVDPSMEPLFDEVAAMADVRLADMNSEQAKKVWDLIRMVERSITTAGQNLTKAKATTTAEWANNFVRDTSTRKGRKGRVIEGLRLDMENPYTFFSHFGQAGMDVYRMLRDAQDRQQGMVSKLRDEVQALISAKEVGKYENEVHEYTTERGDALILTTAHLMEIYELMKRQQAQEHLLKGGIVQPEIKVKGHKTARGNDAILLTSEDLMHMIEPLTDEQMNVADAFQSLTTGILADWGNEASMQAYGYKKFTGEDYWPIHSASEGVRTKAETSDTNAISIKNIGLAKNTVPHASNPLDVDGLFQTFAAHATDMMDYAAWLCPMEDAYRLLNYQFRDASGQPTGRSVKGILDRIGGKGAKKYLIRLLVDIQNGIIAANDTEVEPFINKLYGNVKGASVGANIRVIVQQPTAVFRAAAVMSPLDIAAGLVRPGGWKTAVEHSPIAKRKDVGGFDISSPAQMAEMLYDSKSGLQKFNAAMMWGAGKADSLTWGWMWKACEHAIKKSNPGLSGEDFYRAVNEMFTDVIDQSQVVDGILQRSQMMRSGNAWVKQATAFMGEPTMTANMLIRAWDQLSQESDKSKRGKAWKKFGRTLTALVITNAVNALAQSLVDAVRDDDEDKEYWERFWSAFIGIEGDEKTAWEKAVAVVLNGNAGQSVNPVGYVPFVKDVLSILQGYNVTRADADAVGDVIKAVQTALDSFSGNGKKTVPYALKELANQAGKVFGISSGNILRDAWGIMRSIAVETGNVVVQYEMEKAIYKIGADGNNGRFIDILFRAYQTEPEMYERIYADMVANGIPEDTIKKGMESRMKKAEGVKSVDDLEERYLPPDLRVEYDAAKDGVKKSSLWSSATADQRSAAADELYNMVCNTGDGQRGDAIVEGGASVGLDETEYILYRLALSMYDKPNDKGNLGTYTNDEIAAAISATPGLTKREKSYLWEAVGKSAKSNPYK